MLRSPYDPAHWLVFWSRLDPELTRYYPLPFEGSDWVVYDDYLPLAQGFREQRRLAALAERERREGPSAGSPAAAGGTALGPLDPAPRSGSSRSRSSRGGARGTRGGPGRSGAAHGAALAGPAHRAVRVSRRADQAPAHGVPDPVHSLAAVRELHAVADYATSTNPHEEIHLLARAKHGPCHSTALYEGLAYATEGAFRGGELDLHAAFLIEQDQLPTLGQLLDEEKLRALPRAAAFPATGLLVRWLRARVEDAVFWKLYGAAPADEQAVAQALGLTPEAAATAFRAWVMELGRSRRRAGLAAGS